LKSLTRRADIDLQRSEQVGRGARHLRLGAIVPDLRLEQREDLGEARRLLRPLHHRVGRLQQGLRAVAAAILDHHAHAAGIADAGDRRRLDHQHQRLLDAA
jgi:hypothetical protein